MQLENAKADASWWDDVADMHNETIEENKRLIEKATRLIANAVAKKKEAAEHAARAKDRIEQIERGEDVPGGLHKPMTHKDVERHLRSLGMTTADMKHCAIVHEIHTYGKEAWEAFMELHHQRSEKEAKRTARDMLRTLEVRSSGVTDFGGSTAPTQGLEKGHRPR